ncbi:hypothetical protein ACQ4PT_054707 [Festuca glaucescens]
MESVADDIVREILLKLPTRDAARCHCISKQWCSLLTDPSFIDVHAQAAHIVSGAAEALLVSHSESRDTTLHSVLSAKPICSVTDLGDGYKPINVCNGFLLLALPGKQCHLFVCNPITGEKLKIPAPPRIMSTCRPTYAMGFSPSTRQYKLFRLSARDITSWDDAWESYLEVYTLGNNGGGWRRNPHTIPYRVVYDLHMPSPPALVDGKLYMVTERPWDGETPDRMLVIDVASETHYTYPLPEKFKWGARAAVHPLEMCRQLCVAVRFLGQPFLRFWVMLPLEDTKVGMVHCSWKSRYT